jgi:hypothetical protein
MRRKPNQYSGIKEMLLKYMESNYIVATSVEECSSLVQEALQEVGLKKVVVKKEVAPNYLLITYSPGWVGKALEIEFVFRQRQNGTEISVKWPYAEEVPTDIEHPAEFYKQEQERRHKTERLIEKFRTKIGATEISSSKSPQKNNQ